jgi:integrase/recombinase XerD
MRLYADYLNREYRAVDSDYVFVNLWAAPAGCPMTYPAAYDLVTRLRAATGISWAPRNRLEPSRRRNCSRCASSRNS